uniref:Uncharacterized protein n=1 Tax=Cereibacter sphaeroides (strain ATCC 17025 / ATH 2.4.3) TaxID=349102 RepID=A4WY27_CERS5
MRSNANHAPFTGQEARFYKNSPALARSCVSWEEDKETVQWTVFPTQARWKPSRFRRADRGHAGGRARQAEGRARPGPPPLAGFGEAADARRRQGLGRRGLRPGSAAGLRHAHVAQKARFSAIDGRTTRHEGYALSQRCRKKIDLRRGNDPLDRCLILLTFGWAKAVGPMAQMMLHGAARVGARFTFTMAACNLAPLPRLLAA